MNKKRIFSIIIIMVMVCAMVAAGCGKKEETTKNKDEPKQEETKKEEADKAEPEKDAEAVDDEKQEEIKDDSSSKPADLSEASAEMGVSEEKVQELHNIVKGILEEKYFPKYNISPEEFEWPSGNDEAGDTHPWIYLQIKVQKKLFGSTMDSDNPADYNLDEQLTDLMDYTCEGISEWIDSNDYGGLSPWVAWNYVFGPYDLW